MASLIPWGRGRSRRGEITSRRTHPLAQLQDEFDALWDRFFTGWPMANEELAGSQRFWDLDMEDADNEIVVRAEVPGFDPNDLDVQINNNILTIKAEKKQENKEEERGRQEQRYAMYQRSITLPPGTNPDKAQADYRNGVLELHIPKSEEGKGKRIPIQSETKAQTALPKQGAAQQTKPAVRQETATSSSAPSGAKRS